MLSSERGELFSGPDDHGGLLVYDPVLRIAAVSGTPSEAAWDAWSEAERPWRSFLVQAEDLGAAASRLRFVRLYEAVLHGPPVEALVPRARDPAGRPLGARDAASLTAWPAEQARDVLLALESDLPSAAILVEDELAAVCYACYTTETLWDVSIDTAPAFRRRGLAGAAVRALAGRLAADGLAPCWGADVANEASLALAASLGFEATERFFVFESGLE